METFDNGEILHLETSLPSSSNIMNAYLQGFSVTLPDKEIVQCVNVSMAGDHCQNYLPYHFDFRRFFFLATLAHVSFVPKSRLFFFLEGGGGVGEG